MILSRIKLWLAAAGAVIVAVAAAFLRGRAAGKGDERNDRNEDTLERLDAGRRNIDRDGDPNERLRRNDSDW